MDEEVQNVFNHSAAKPVAYVVAGFLVGLGVGYLLGRRNSRLPSPPPEELEKITQELSALRARREAKVLSDEVIVPRRYAEDVVEEEVEVQVITVEDPDWDYEEEKQTRDSLSPYVIHRDEFFSNEMDFAQHTWTYYEGDDVMIDEEDVVVYNHNQKVGDDLKWGHGSGDPNTVYIRNEKMRMEMEVLREEGLYSIEVMGLEPDRGEDQDVKHSNTRKNKRSEYDE